MRLTDMVILTKKARYASMYASALTYNRAICSPTMQELIEGYRAGLYIVLPDGREDYMWMGKDGLTYAHQDHRLQNP